MNHYPMHPGDYLRDTAHLSIIEDAVYRRILDWLYINERPLPTDSAKVARLMRVIEHQDAVDAVLNEFLELTADGWVQRRAEREIAEYKARADSARENGRRGGRPKTEAKPKITDPVNSGLPEKTELKTNQNQNQNQNQYIPPTPQGGDEDDQDKIPASWTIDPRHRFAMPTDWQPTESTLAGYIAGKIAVADGKPLTVGRVMEILPRWREESNASANVMTDAQWTLRLVRYAMQYKDTANSANAPKNGLPGGRNDTSKPHPLAFTEENRPERGPYALFKPGPKKTPMTDEGRARVEQLRRQAFGDAA